MCLLSQAGYQMQFGKVYVVAHTAGIGTTGEVMEETGVRRRTSIRIADNGAVEKDARIRAYAGAQKKLENSELEQMKIEVGVKAFVQGTSKDSREFIEMERMALLTQQHERICSRLAETAAQRRSRELQVCALSITGALLFIATVVLLMLRF